MVSRWSFAFTRKSLENVLRRVKEALRTSPGRRLDYVLKNGRRDFHFRPIKKVFEMQIKMNLRRLCDTFLSVG